MYTPENFSFLQVAIYLGFFSPKEGKIFLEERARLFREGQDLPLSRLLLKKGSLGPSQIKKIEGWMRDGYFFCTHCKVLYSTGALPGASWRLVTLNLGVV